MHNRSNNEDKLAKLLSITWAKAVELESETDSLTTRNAKLKAEFLDVGEQFEVNTICGIL